VIADVDAARGEATANECGGTFVSTDVTDDDALRALLAEPVHVLVNNAGGGGHVEPHFPQAPVELWSKWLDLNLRAPLPR
jgi:NAD(P)-dependent dehydrogenase (short-subunit alcohol dehydrogenase family)